MKKKSKLQRRQEGARRHAKGNGEDIPVQGRFGNVELPRLQYRPDHADAEDDHAARAVLDRVALEDHVIHADEGQAQKGENQVVRHGVGTRCKSGMLISMLPFCLIV